MFDGLMGRPILAQTDGIVGVYVDGAQAMPDCNDDDENALVGRARRLLATYEDMAELIRIGAYKRGSDPAIDEAIHYYPQLEAFLSQDRSEICTLSQGYAQLASVLSMSVPDRKPEPEVAAAAAGEAVAGSEMGAS